MLFTDIPVFWLFLLIAVGISLLTRNNLVANKFALIAISIIFFALYAPRDAGLFIIIVLANYGLLALADKSNNPQKRRYWAAGLAFVNVGVLLYFKYFDFLFLGLASEIGFDWLSPNSGRQYFELMNYTSVADLVWVPLALSFYTFHIISYCVDVLTGKSRLAPFCDYLLYLSFFPHLLAGPIVRGNQLIPRDFKPHLKNGRLIGAGRFISMSLVSSSKWRSPTRLAE